MAQDFWSSSGYAALERRDQGLRATPAWISRFLQGPELMPPAEAGAGERKLHERLLVDPAARVEAAQLAAVEDADARENWTEFLRFRDRALAASTLEACYTDLYRRAKVDLAPPFVDALVQAIVRGMLEGTADPWLCRAAETLFRRQRIAVEGGKVLAADAATIQVFSETGGFGNVGRLLLSQNTPVPQVKMDVMSEENAALYFMRDELYGFVLDLSPGGPGAAALARVLERWVGHLAGVRVSIEPRERIDDARWRWHVGLDVDASSILNALYRGESVEPAELERLVLLFALAFSDPRDALADLGGRPVYLGLGCRPDRTLKLKPQNLLVNLPLGPAS
jgi:hypothetical protein